ncbi:hypothetical protein LTR66_015069, partial [Elasticomyces elasticus]
HDFDLWDLLHDYKKVRYGCVGALAIWYGMRNRGPAVKLDDNIPTSKILRWKLIEDAIEIKSEPLIREICQQKYSVTVHDDLYPRLMALLLHTRPNAEQFQLVLRISYWLIEVEGHELPTFEVLCQFCKPESNRQVLLLLNVYLRAATGTSQYDRVMKYAWKDLEPDVALILHKRLIAGDKPHSPTQTQALTPLVMYLAKTKEDLTPYLNKLEAVGISFSHQARYLYDTACADDGDEFARLSKNASERGLSDAFVARAFATRLLSFEFVLNSLLVFGLREIRPQVIREIGQADPDPVALLGKLKSIDEHSIDTGSSAYVNLIKTLCLGKQTRLLQQLLTTDMHHDIFEDEAKQLQLLADHLERGRWQVANLLVCTLNGGKIDSSTKNVFGLAVTGKLGLEKPLSSETLCLETSWSSTPNSSNFPYQLSKTIPRLEAKSTRRKLHVAAGTLQDLMLSGQHVALSTWGALLVRTIGLGTHKHVRRMCLWIAEWYSPEGLGNRLLPQPLGPIDTDPSRAFGKQFQAMIVYRAINRTFLHNPVKARRLVFQPVLKLLQTLHNEYGVFLHSQYLQQFRRRLVVQFRRLIHRSRLAHIRGRTATGPRELRKIMLSMLSMFYDIFGASTSQRLKNWEFDTASKMVRQRRKCKARTRPQEKFPSLITKEFMQDYRSASIMTTQSAPNSGDVVVVHTENVHSTIKM